MIRKMKWSALLLGGFLLCSTLSYGQSVGDSTRSRERQRTRRVQDENGDGISDRALDRQRLRRGMDRFIDANGNGISDNREGGLGFRRGKMELQTEPGKQGMRKGQKGK
jgi:hypothetical protein